jgi:hypothetical protein
MGVSSPVDSVKLRVKFTVPVKANDLAELQVTTKGTVSSVDGIGAILRIQLMGWDGGGAETKLLEWTEFVNQGPFNKTFVRSISTATLNEDRALHSRDEVFVYVIKEGIGGVLPPSSPKASARVYAYFGIGESAPNN